MHTPHQPETTTTYHLLRPPRLPGTIVRFLLWNLVGFPAWFPMMVFGHPGLGAAAAFIVVGGGCRWLWLVVHTVDTVRLGPEGISVERRGQRIDLSLDSAFVKPSKLAVFTSGGGFLLRSSEHKGRWFVARATEDYLELTAQLALFVTGGRAFSSAVLVDRLERRQGSERSSEGQ